MTRMYRFFNFVQDKYGEPFALCDKHKDKQIVPDTCVLQKIAEMTDWKCEMCMDEEDQPAKSGE